MSITREGGMDTIRSGSIRRSRRAKGRLRRRFNLKALGFILVVIGGLEVLVDLGVVPGYFPAPRSVASTLVREIYNGTILEQLAVTLRLFAEGMAVALAVGALLGAMQGLSKTFYAASRTLVELCRPIPSVAFIPPAILVLGLGDAMGITIVAYGAIWPILVNTYYAVTGVDRGSIETARSMKLTIGATIRDVITPSALPGVAAGIRISAAIGLSLAVVVELVAGRSGIGYYMEQAQSANHVAELYAAIVLIGAVGYAINLVLVRLEIRFFHWTPTAIASRAAAREAVNH